MLVGVDLAESYVCVLSENVMRSSLRHNKSAPEPKVSHAPTTRKQSLKADPYPNVFTSAIEANNIYAGRVLCRRLANDRLL